VPTLSANLRERFWTLEKERVAHAAVLAGASPGTATPSSALPEVEDEIDGILAEDCPLCGRLMIQTIQRPFVDADEAFEIEAWKI